MVDCCCNSSSCCAFNCSPEQNVIRLRLLQFTEQLLQLVLNALYVLFDLHALFADLRL